MPQRHITFKLTVWSMKTHRYFICKDSPYISKLCSQHAEKCVRCHRLQVLPHCMLLNLCCFPFCPYLYISATWAQTSECLHPHILYHSLHYFRSYNICLLKPIHT